ncbi:MAG: hypothetical protein JXK05_04450 [Campylobacterales bacterium]|nr:hypothetical protein [Campylobacterales bacterium]
MKLLFLILPLFLCAQMLKVGDGMAPKVFEDQFGKSHETTQHYRWISWDKGQTAMLRDFFETHPQLYARSAFIVDVSQIPSGIWSLFVKPSLKEYPRPILLSFDEVYNRTLPYQEGFITLLEVNASKITAVRFIGSEAELEKLDLPLGLVAAEKVDEQVDVAEQ